MGRPQIDDTVNEINDFIQLTPTPGAEKCKPIIPDVVINEIYYKAVNENDALYEYMNCLIVAAKPSISTMKTILVILGNSKAASNTYFLKVYPFHLAVIY